MRDRGFGLGQVNELAVARAGPVMKGDSHGEDGGNARYGVGVVDRGNGREVQIRVAP